jgi:hypothetical protein
MSRAFTILDEDVSSSVVDWGSIEEIKEVLLVTAELFSSSHTVVLDNSDRKFSLDSGLFGGRNPLNSPCVITENGQILFQGLCRAFSLSKADRKATITIENYLSPLTAQVATKVQTGANPASVALALLLDAGLADVVDTFSFYAAAGVYTQNDAVISVDFAGSSTTVLAAIQKISQLASLAVYMSFGKIRAKAFVPYQGSSVGLRQPLTVANVVSMDAFEAQPDVLKNAVTIKYGAASELTVTDPESIIRNRGTFGYKFDTQTGGEISVADEASARFFANLFLARASTLRYTLTIKGDSRLGTPALGHRHAITDTQLGIADRAFEVIEIHRAINSDSVELLLATID